MKVIAPSDSGPAVAEESIPELVAYAPKLSSAGHFLSMQPVVLTEENPEPPLEQLWYRGDQVNAWLNAWTKRLWSAARLDLTEGPLDAEAAPNPPMGEMQPGPVTLVAPEVTVRLRWVSWRDGTGAPWLQYFDPARQWVDVPHEVVG